MDLLKQRRRFLIGALAAGAATGAGLLLPFNRPGLARMIAAKHTDGAKLKVVFYVVPDGLGIDKFMQTPGAWNGNGIWHPKADAMDTEDFVLNEASEVLEGHRKHLLFLRSITLMRAGTGFGGHAAWDAVLRDSSSKKTSIDNWIANAFSSRLMYAGPHTKVESGGNPFFVSWVDGNMMTPEKNPRVLFDKWFTGASSNPLVAARNVGLFAPVEQDIKEIREGVGAADRARLDVQLDAIEQVKKDLENGPGPAPGCEPIQPRIITDTEVDSPDYRNEVHQLHHQVVATALGCGLTRVATIQVAYSSEAQITIPEVDEKVSPHDLAHWGLFGGEGSPEAEMPWKNRNRWYTRKFGEFLDELDKHADPDVPSDSLLQHTLVIFTSEMSDGFKEHMYDMPLVMAGGASGMLRNGSGQGRFFNITDQGDLKNEWENDRPRNDVLMQRIWATVANAVGAPPLPYDGNLDLVTGIFNTP